MADWPSVRALYPALQRWAFLNTATFGQLSTRTRAAMTAYLDRRDETACSDFLSWFEDHDLLRGKLARLIRAEAGDIAYFPNACSALGLLVAGLPWQAGDQILRLESEFPNQIYAPAHAARRGVEVVAAQPETLLESLGPRTRLVVISTVNYTTGYAPPLDELAAECRRRDIVLYVDGTQSLGAIQFDFGRLQPDMFAVNCYKWMLAPNGAAFAAVHPRLREKLDAISIGWRSHHDWRNVDHLHLGTPELVETADKYEGGMLSSIVLYGLEASVDLMLELGPAAIEARVRDLAAKTRAALRDAGAEPLPHEGSGIVAAALPGRDASQAARDLKARGVQVSARHGLLRVSTHFYNDESDIARLAEVLR